MTADLDELSSELADELARNSVVDPRLIPTRFSLLKQLALSPAHYFEACQREQDDSMSARLGSMAPDKSDALRFGTAVHSLLLGQQCDVALWTGKVRNGRAWDAFRDEQEALGRKAILNAREYRLAIAVSSAIQRHPRAMGLLFDGTRVEQRIDWTWLGRAVRSTPDAHRPGEHVADLKTAVTAKPDVFARAALRLHYHCQGALYADACEASFPHDEIRNVYVIAVEKSRPHPVVVFRITEDAIVAGAKLNRLWMEELLTCEASNSWPGYSESDVDLDVPKMEGFEIEVDGKLMEVT